MANFLTSLGRTGGGLTRATQGILNQARGIRQQRLDERSLALQERQANIEEGRASQIHGLDVRQKQIDINIAENKQETLEEEQKLNARPVEMLTIKKAMNNPKQFEMDWIHAKSLGRVDKFSDGNEYMTIGNLKWFKENIQDTPIYRQSFTHNNLMRFTAEVDQYTAQLEEITAPLEAKGKTAKEIGEMPEVKQILQALQISAQGKATAMANDAELSKLMKTMIDKYGMEAAEKWRTTGDTSVLVEKVSTGKVSDFERAYQQHIALPGNATVTRAEFKTGPFSMPRGELTDDAVLGHFEQLALMVGYTRDNFEVLKQAAFKRFSDNQDEGMSRREAFNEAKEWVIRRPESPEDLSDVAEFDYLYKGQVGMFEHPNK